MKDWSEKERKEFIEQITRESEPMRITNYMVDYPCRVICVSYLLLIIFSVITVFAGYMTPSLVGGRGRDLLIWKDPLNVNKDKFVLATEFLDETKGDATVDIQTEVTNGVFILYSNTGGHPNGLLNIEALKIMKKMEDTIQQDEGYKKYCLAKKPLQETDPVTCDDEKFSSALSMIIGETDLETATQQEINDNFLALMK